MIESVGLGRHPSPGDILGTYRLHKAIGAGGMATVFLAIGADGGSYAVKVLNPARVVPEDVKRFTREYEALARMDHENIVRVYAAGVERGYPWLAMEYIEGTDLGTLIESWEADLPGDHFDRVERILRGLCRALQYVHDLGLVHRDLKPGNVLITKAGEARLTDFGVVKDASWQTQLTMAGRLVGTVAFMAPEQITGDEVDRRTDLYALGAILYMMLTLKRPIEATSVAGYLARHLTEVPRPPSEIDPQIPRRLERICQRLLGKERNSRYPTALAVLQALDRATERESLPARGRDSEIAVWSARVLALLEGGSAAVALIGPPGIGKTHLFHAMLDHVANSGAVAVFADATRADPLDELIRTFGLDPAAAADGGRPAMLRAAMAGKRCVVGVDALDRANPAAIDGIARVVRDRVSADGEPVLLLFTATELQPVLQGLASGQATGVHSEQVAVGPLDVKAVTALLRDRGISGPLAPVLGRRLFLEYRGVPGLVVQQLEALVAAGWLTASAPEAAPELKAARPIDAFRKEELPVPVALNREISERIARLDAEGREMMEILAAIDRPVSRPVVERCVARPEKFERTLEGLLTSRLVVSRQEEGQEVVELGHPFAARVVRAATAPEVRRRHHAAIARSLSGRRSRAAGLEVARHLEAAGDLAHAYGTYIQAARRASRDAQHGEVLDMLERIDALRPRVEPGLDLSDAGRQRMWTELIRGETLLARGQWGDACVSLELASQLGKAWGQELVPRALAGLGRALYRRGRVADARPFLEEALRTAEPGAPERMSAARALADIHLQQGDLPGSARRWLEALDLATGSGSRDAEARARRGLAHLRAIEGRFLDALNLLEHAEDLLDLGGDDRVRAGVMARIVDLELAAGRFAIARKRAEGLVELARRRDMPERLSAAYGIYGMVLLALGEDEEGGDAAHQAVVFARAHGPQAWEGRLLAASILADLGDRAGAAAALPAVESVPGGPIDDWPAQLAVSRARIAEDRGQARDLASWALARPPPLLGLRGGRVAIDAARALLRAGDPVEARGAAKRALRILQGPGLDGLLLDALLVLSKTAPDERVEGALAQVADRVRSGLPPEMAVGLTRRIERFAG
jgi:tetratricopeptide (TPR) repeat protein